MSTSARAVRKRLINTFDYSEPDVLTGTTDIDISAADYTGYIAILTIAPGTGGIKDLTIDLDFDKATTGVNEVATNADTLDCLLQLSADGTNYVGVEAMTQITLTGTAGSIANAIGGHRFKVGDVDENGLVKVLVKLSAERADAEIPYRITYSAINAPTVTAVAAG